MTGPVFIPDPDALRGRIVVALRTAEADLPGGSLMSLGSTSNVRALWAAGVVAAVLAEVGVPAVEEWSEYSSKYSTIRRFVTITEAAL